jgi:hypothetical protein
MDLLSSHLRLISFHYRNICNKLAMWKTKARAYILQVHLITCTNYNRSSFVCFSWYEASTVNWTAASECEFLLLCHVCVAVYFNVQSCSNTLCCVGQSCYPGTASQVQYPLRAMWLSHECHLIYSFNQMCFKCFKFQGAHLGVQDYVICQGCVRSSIKGWVTLIFIISTCMSTGIRYN